MLFYALADGLEAHEPSRAASAGKADSLPAGKRRFRIVWGLTNADYRWQALALTPLGTHHEKVRTFVLQEWRAEERKLTGYDVQSETRLDDDLLLIRSREIVQEQVPHAVIADTGSAFAAQAGRSYIHTNPICRPVWWRPELAATTIHVFDVNKRLTDLFVTQSAVKGYNPLAEF